MPDFILRDSAIQCAKDLADGFDNNGFYLMAAGAYAVADWLEDIPAADVVEVVRCKDCLYDHACLMQQFVEEAGKIPFDRNVFFCSDGKRRTDNA